MGTVGGDTGEQRGTASWRLTEKEKKEAYPEKGLLCLFMSSQNEGQGKVLVCVLNMLNLSWEIWRIQATALGGGEARWLIWVIKYKQFCTSVGVWVKTT